jgi:hypothetical protein
MLTHCEKCNQPLPPGVEDCPHCGYSSREAGKTIRRKIALVVGFYLAVLVVGLVLLANRTIESRQQDEIVAAVRANIDAVNSRDLNAVIAAIHPESPGLRDMKNTAEDLFKKFELRSTLKEIAIESVAGDEAKVRFSQMTEKLSGPGFQDNRVDGVHTLRRHNGEWKLYSTEVTNIVYLDK